MENLRRVTAAQSTIPLGVAGTGTIDFPAGSELGIVSGTTWDDAHNDFKNGVTPGGTENLWLYINSAIEVRKITGVSIIKSGVNLSVSVYIESPFTGAVVAQPFEVVNGDLRFFSILNDGGADGEVNGVVVEDNTSINRSKRDYPIGNLLDVVVVSAAATSFLIDEQLD